MKRIFISYRRADGDVVKPLAERLRALFNRDQIFLDVNQEGGVDYVAALDLELNTCDVAIVVIGQDWLGTHGRTAGRRIDEARDLVRLEVETTLGRNVPVVPVLVHGATMPQDVPPEIAKLPRLHALEIRESQFEPDLFRLVDRLVRILRSWQPVKISAGQQGPEWNHFWYDMAWLTETEGWLCGAVSEGGGGGHVGEGILLTTRDAGVTWRQAANIASGAGQFSWGPQGTRQYRWTEVGPITSFMMHRRQTGDEDRTTGVMATATGVYMAAAPAGRFDHETEWRRSTPPPDHPERYAFLRRLAAIENGTEIYAVGWQGIAHWTERGGRWELQKPTYFYNVAAVAAVGGSENRSVWAVGRAGEDEKGNRGDRSHGAVYHLAWPANRWEQVPLPGIELEEAQTLLDLWVRDPNTVFAVGEQGLILRGVRERSREWTWSRLPAPTDQPLTAIAPSPFGLWILGGGGTILNSLDQGEHWTQLPPVSGADGTGAGWGGVRFFGPAGWIVGNGIVLRSQW
ncbi:MAG TPA: TIR domain-containing protein [Thermoanaerobaculia bacterium]|nr:TIR domain-containing protein [Thermoanaerobaculia bacterium]